MTTVTFDTLEAVAKLRSVGVSQEQAEAFVRTISDAQNELATKIDLRDLEYRLIIKIGLMLAASIGIIAALVKLT
jgi:hypothetical protein